MKMLRLVMWTLSTLACVFIPCGFAAEESDQENQKITNERTNKRILWCLLIKNVPIEGGSQLDHKMFNEFHHIRSHASSDVQTKAVRDLITRLLPEHASKFDIVVQPSFGSPHLDEFEYKTTAESKLQIKGTSGVACSLGLQHFLKNYCHAHISWSGDQLKIPKPFPTVKDLTRITLPYRFRYYQNVCTFSYSSVWWNWTRWQREIDWMALNGINLPLAFTGQEAIWQRVYHQIGLTQQELDTFFGGPAFLAWARMGNIRGWGGPLPPSWRKNQLDLQHKILTAMRNLGMAPVLPGFAGFVPDGLKRVYPQAKLSRVSRWGRFNNTFCCGYHLHPNDPLFKTLGSLFIKEQMSEFGTNNIYNADAFNEMTPTSKKPSYLSGLSSAVYRAMVAGDPNAVWLMQGWLFRDTNFWKPPQVKALLQGVPRGRMIVLDLMADIEPFWSRTESFYGQPFIWCMLQNFGGQLGLFGTIQSVITGPVKAFNSPNSTMIGTGLTPEGIDQNDMMYELMNEMGYRINAFNPVELEEWIKYYALRRYGNTNDNIVKAWKLLIHSVYNCTYYCIGFKHQSVFVRQPTLRIAPHIWYKPEDVFKAWDALISVAKDFSHSKTFRYDLVDISRQALHLLVIPLYHDLILAYNAKSVPQVAQIGIKLLNMFDDLDKILQTNQKFLLGCWLNSAKAMGTTPEEVKLYEYNARIQITLWGPTGEFDDYANKMWSGLVNDYYKPRWELFIEELVDAIRQGKRLDNNAFAKRLLERETTWTQGRKVYPCRPVGDSVEVATFLHRKYRLYSSRRRIELVCIKEH